MSASSIFNLQPTVDYSYQQFNFVDSGAHRQQLTKRNKLQSVEAQNFSSWSAKLPSPKPSKKPAAVTGTTTQENANHVAEEGKPAPTPQREPAPQHLHPQGTTKSVVKSCSSTSTQELTRESSGTSTTAEDETEAQLRQREAEDNAYMQHIQKTGYRARLYYFCLYFFIAVLAKALHSTFGDENQISRPHLAGAGLGGARARGATVSNQMSSREIFFRLAAASFTLGGDLRNRLQIQKKGTADRDSTSYFGTVVYLTKHGNGFMFYHFLFTALCGIMVMEEQDSPEVALEQLNANGDEEGNYSLWSLYDFWTGGGMITTAERTRRASTPHASNWFFLSSSPEVEDHPTTPLLAPSSIYLFLRDATAHASTMVSVLGSMVTLLWYFLVFRNPETHLNYRKASLKTGIDAKMRDICQHVPGLLFGVSEVILRKRSERCWAADVAVTIPEGGSRTTQAGQNTMNMFTSSYIFGGGGPLQLWPAGEAAGREQEGSFTLSFSSVFGGGENEMGTSVPAINLLTDTVSTLLPYFALQAAFQVYYFSFIFVNYKLTNSWPYAILGYVHSRGVKAWALFISCCYVAALILTAVVVLV